LDDSKERVFAGNDAMPGCPGVEVTVCAVVRGMHAG